jgi:endonuclease YncB( thermonuclease family)
VGKTQYCIQNGLLSCFLLLLVSCNRGSELHKVQIVVDGDTVILANRPSSPIDLAYIDAPEREQPYGKEAKRYLKEILNSNDVQILLNQYNQVEIKQNNQSVNLMLVEQGFAWASPNISDPIIATRFIEAQKNAVTHLSGLWALGHGLRVAPWQWRQQSKQQMPMLQHHYSPSEKRILGQPKRAPEISDSARQTSTVLTKVTKE